MPPGAARGQSPKADASIRIVSRNSSGEPAIAPLDVVAICLTPLLVLLQGHRFGVGNHEFLLASMRRAQDPTYLVNDWFLSTPAHHPLLVAILAPLSGSVGEPAALLGVHLATRLLLLAGVWRLAMALVGGNAWVAVAAMVATFFEPRLRIGSHYLQGGHWEPAFLGMACAVWIVLLAMRFAGGRRGAWLPLVLVGGGGIAAHLFICLPVFGIAVVAAALVRRDFAIPAGVVAAGLFLGSPSLFPAIKGFFLPGDSPLSAREVILVLQYRHPHHHQPWTWPASHYVQAALVLVAGALSLWRITPAGERRLLVVPGALIVYAVASSALFALCAALRVLPIVAYIQCFRLIPLAMAIAAIGMLGALWRTLGGRGIAFFSLAALAGAVLFRLAGVFGPGLVSIAALALAWRPLPASIAPLALSTRRWPILAMGAASLAVIVALQASAPLRDRINAIRGSHWLATAEPTDPVRARLAEWIRANTPRQAIISIPATMEGFHIWEQRAVVVDLKNVPYRNAGLAEWSTRIALATGDNPMRPGATPSTTDPDPEFLIQLAGRYRASYVVLRGKIAHSRDVYPWDDYTVIEAVNGR